jgi:recombination protein RecT
MSDTVKNKLAAKAQAPEVKEAKNMKQHIQAMGSEISKALPEVITPERFTRMALTAISTNGQLANSSPRSLLGALMNAAQLGLEPNTPLGQAYLIPFRNGKTGEIETQFQIG